MRSFGLAGHPGGVPWLGKGAGGTVVVDIGQRVVKSAFPAVQQAVCQP